MILYKEYEPERLKKLQEFELEMLNDFDELCQENSIEYFVCGGTALGGVRHDGFIPWDDDIDIGMTREHYNKFLQVAAKEYKRKYRVINPEINSDFPVILTKWYNKNTVFQNQEYMKLGIKLGIAIDIFCFDNIADDKRELKKQAMRAWTFGKLLILRSISDPINYVGGWKSKLIHFAAIIANCGLRLLHISPKWLYKQADKAVRKYEDEQTKRVAYLFDPTPYTSVVRRDDIYPTVRRKFENIELSFPHHVENYLKRRYGDNYMELPPEDSRHNHAPEILKFENE